jgi:hypothetical protein
MRVNIEKTLPAKAGIQPPPLLDAGSGPAWNCWFHCSCLPLPPPLLKAFGSNVRIYCSVYVTPRSIKTDIYDIYLKDDKET